jgi:hypothetical protein
VYRLAWVIAASMSVFVMCCGRTSGAGKGGGSDGSVGAIPGPGGAVADAAEPDTGSAMGDAEGPFRDARISDEAEARDLDQNDDSWPPDQGEAGLSGDAAIDRWGPAQAAYRSASPTASVVRTADAARVGNRAVSHPSDCGRGELEPHGGAGARRVGGRDG